MKLIKFLLKTIVTLILLIVIIAIAIPFLINPNDYKQQIAEQVKLQTGRDLKINGDISVSLSLPMSLAFQLGETEMSNTDDFIKLSKNPFLKVDQVAVNASILPLLQENRLEVGKVILNKAQIYLLKNKQGNANWENFSKAKTSAIESSVTESSVSKNNTFEKQTSAVDAADADKSTAKGSIPEIHIAGVEISDSMVVFDDLSSGQQVQLNKVNLTISELKENKPVDLDFNLSFKIKSNNKNSDANANLEGDLSLKTQANINLKKQLYQLHQTTLDLAIAGQTIPGGKNNTKLSANIDIDLANQLLAIEQLNMDSYLLNLQGQFNVAQLMSEPQFKGQLDLAKFSPKELLKLLAINIPEMKNPKVLNSSSVKLQLEGNTKQLKLTDLIVLLDDVTIKGNAGILNLNNPSYQLKLDINKLHLDDYALVNHELVNKDRLNNTSDTTTADTTEITPAKNQAVAPVALIPVELLKQLNVDGQLKIAELTSNGIKMSNIILSLKGNNGLITLDPVQSDFYKGKLKLKTSIDVRNKTPKIDLQQDFSQIDLGQLLLDATESQDFTGTANISSHITSFGNYQDDLIKNSNGKGKFLITDGNIAKLEVLHNVRQAYALLHGQPAPTQKQKENTSFTELKGSVTINNGVVNNNDLFSKSPLLQLTGAGYADLPKQYLDYSLKVLLLNSLQIDKNNDSTDFRSQEIPYTIKGKFSELSQQANIKNIVEQQAKAEANKQINKQLDKQLQGDKGKKIEDKIGKDNMKKLQGLFKF